MNRKPTIPSLPPANPLHARKFTTLPETHRRKPINDIRLRTPCPIGSNKYINRLVRKVGNRFEKTRRIIPIAAKALGPGILKIIFGDAD